MYRFRLFALALMLCLVTGARAEKRLESSEEAVKLTITAAKAEGGKQVVTATLVIAKGWHLYANPVGNDPLTPAQTALTFTSGGKPVAATVKYPAGTLLDGGAGVGMYRIYEGTIVITATIDRADTAPVEAQILLQACNEKRGVCLVSSTVKRKID